ncbi:lmo0937 family membrane protein [Arthrobacter sp. NPDC058130]
MLWIAIILAVPWLLGLLGGIGGGLIHLLLVIAVVVLIFHFIRDRSRA